MTVVFPATWAGDCGDCGEPITPGDPVRFEGEAGQAHLVHAGCGEQPTIRGRTRRHLTLVDPLTGLDPRDDN